VLADAVHDVVTLPRDRVLEPPDSVAGVAREYLRGVTADALISWMGRSCFRIPAGGRSGEET